MSGRGVYFESKCKARIISIMRHFAMCSSLRIVMCRPVWFIHDYYYYCNINLLFSDQKVCVFYKTKKPVWSCVFFFCPLHSALRNNPSRIDNEKYTYVHIFTPPLIIYVFSYNFLFLFEHCR